MRNFVSPSNGNIHNLEVLENGNPKKKLIWHLWGIIGYIIGRTMVPPFNFGLW